MKAPIPTRTTFWWNDTDDAYARFGKKPFNQGEKWWTDDQLDKKALSLWGLHCEKRRSSPWFMESTAGDYSELDIDAPWLNDAEKTQLLISDQFMVNYKFENQEPMQISVPKALLISFSRLAKEGNLECKLGGIPFFVPSWYAYVEQSWKKCIGFQYTLRPMDRLSPEDRMGTEEQFIKASGVFFQWMATGLIVMEADDFINKTYMLKLARALGAPLFRHAILHQI